MEEIHSPKRRVTIKHKNPNPLFDKWLSEWHREEVSAGKFESIYSKALESLRKFPLVLKTGFECILLEHFDEELCSKLSHRLAEYEAAPGIIEPEKNRSFAETTKTQEHAKEIVKRPKSVEESKEKNNISPPISLTDNVENENEPQPGKKRKKRPYVPMKRSAAFGILLSLLLKENEPGYVGYSTKAEIIVASQKHSDVSMKKTGPGSFYTGWSSMSQLVSKGLVERFSNPAKFKLTDEGRELASKLKNDSVSSPTEEIQEPVLSLVSASELIAPEKPRGRKTKNKVLQQVDPGSTSSQSQESSAGISSQTSSQDRTSPGKSSRAQEFSIGPSSRTREFLAGHSSQSQEFSAGTSSQSQEFVTEEMVFLPNNFEVILLVDSGETEGKQRRNEDECLVLLDSLKVKFEVRGLKVGDYLWVARDPVGREMVLPYIIERKRVDDLARSIKDGRFHEQKFRLKLCGLQNKIYLVENHGYSKVSPFMESVKQAITNTMVCDQFMVKSTKDLSETVRYLATMTKILVSTFQNKTLFSCKKESLGATIDLKDDIVSLLSFAEFSYQMDKTKDLTPREDFALQLVQLNGMSSDKAWAITEVYPTPKSLIEGFIHGEAEKTISELRSGLGLTKIGPQLSSVLRTFYTSSNFSG